MAGIVSGSRVIYKSVISSLLLLSSISVPAAQAQVPQRAVDARDLATRLVHAEGVPRDLPRAYRLYCLAALLGDATAMYHLGEMHLNGRGTERDDSIAKDWLQRADARGDRYAKRLLDTLAHSPASTDPVCQPRPESGAPAPQRIAAWVRLLAPEYDLEPALVLSVIRAESNFNPRALSHKNAHGLMQLIPPTAERFSVADIWDPVENLNGGMAYLSWLQDTFERDPVLMVAAYNAGEQAVQRYGGVPPYPETRLYVKRVMAGYRGR